MLFQVGGFKRMDSELRITQKNVYQLLKFEFYQWELGADFLLFIHSIWHRTLMQKFAKNN